MKKTFPGAIALAICITLLASCSSFHAAAQPVAAEDISYQTFYDDLSPYGTWIDYPGYGHVWHPSVTGEFRPYLTNGYWNYSNDGWLWISNYSWGWAPFHYGRWIYDDAYGWLWIPGYEWSPAWVTWGNFDNYYAWAPLMPNVYVGLQFNLWRPSAFYWNVCGRDHICDRDVYNHIVQRNVVNANINRITIINNFNTTKLHNQYYSRGPQLADVQKYTSHKIATVSIKDTKHSNQTGHAGNEIHMYRPAITQPQPHEFRRMKENAGPAIGQQDHFNGSHQQQQQNIDRLPRMRAPERIFSGRGNMNRAGGAANLHR